jgi:hypothetical protein
MLPCAWTLITREQGKVVACHFINIICCYVYQYLKFGERRGVEIQPSQSSRDRKICQNRQGRNIVVQDRPEVTAGMQKVGKQQMVAALFGASRSMRQDPTTDGKPNGWPGSSLTRCTPDDTSCGAKVVVVGILGVTQG